MVLCLHIILCKLHLVSWSSSNPCSTNSGVQCVTYTCLLNETALDLIMMNTGKEKLSKDVILQRLKERDVTERMQEEDIVAYASQKRQASVLVPLSLGEEGDLHVLLTTRAATLRSDAGDVAFPGGKRDEEDADKTATALREAQEEIGLLPSDVEVVSQLPPLLSRTGYFVTPIVGFIDPNFVPNINPHEVDDVFQVPLIDFLLCDHHKSMATANKGRFAKLHFFSHEIDGKSFTTYGLTAYMCILAACAVYNRAPDFEMEPGFDHVHLAQGFLDHIERKKREQLLAAEGSKL